MRRMIATRSGQGVRAQPGAAARAAAMASRTSSRVPFAKRPTSEPSIGESLSKVSRRRAPAAVDEEAVGLAELASRDRQAGVVGSVELLVVVAQRGVGDLEPGLGRFGHPERLLVTCTWTWLHRLGARARSRAQPLALSLARAAARALVQVA